jgi:hypothetical protein
MVGLIDTLTAAGITQVPQLEALLDLSHAAATLGYATDVELSDGVAELRESLNFVRETLRTDRVRTATALRMIRAAVDAAMNNT